MSNEGGTGVRYDRSPGSETQPFCVEDTSPPFAFPRGWGYAITARVDQ